MPRCISPTTSRLTPDKPAMIVPGRGEVTFAQLEARSNQLAHLLYDRGLRRGDHIASTWKTT